MAIHTDGEWNFKRKRKLWCLTSLCCIANENVLCGSNVKTWLENKLIPPLFSSIIFDEIFSRQNSKCHFRYRSICFEWMAIRSMVETNCMRGIGRWKMKQINQQSSNYVWNWKCEGKETHWATNQNHFANDQSRRDNEIITRKMYIIKNKNIRLICGITLESTTKL